MLLRTIAFAVAFLCIFTYANAVEITPYGAFNYKWSHDENSSGVAYDKLENNGSNIGIDISEPSIEGSTIGAVAKLQVGIDVDDSGSDTFDSQLAYVGIVNNGVTLSVGRQSHPFTDNIGGKSSSFNVYGGSSDFNYASRSSNSIALSSDMLDVMAVVDGSSGQEGIDEYEVTLSHSLMGADVSIGYADDVVNDISYWGAGASTSVGDITIGSSYTVYDAATDKVGMEATIGWKAITVGYGDKEGTGTYMTYGLSHNMTESLSVYAEMQQEDLDTGTDLQHYSVGTKFSF
tara:strand:+ start:1488 stop:2357 length:870 start_codon:yes stop_codon:yes gene_type:complete